MSQAVEGPGSVPASTSTHRRAWLSTGIWSSYERPAQNTPRAGEPSGHWLHAGPESTNRRPQTSGPAGRQPDGPPRLGPRAPPAPGPREGISAGQMRCGDRTHHERQASKETTPAAEQASASLRADQLTRRATRGWRAATRGHQRGCPRRAAPDRGLLHVAQCRSAPIDESRRSQVVLLKLIGPGWTGRSLPMNAEVQSPIDPPLWRVWTL